VSQKSKQNGFCRNFVDSSICCGCRAGSYEYKKGTTSIIEETVKRIPADDNDGQMMATPMQFEIVTTGH